MLTKEFEMVREFNSTFGVKLRDSPAVRVPETQLRFKLIWEEIEELEEAINNLDAVEMADALADIFVVVAGAIQVFGLKYSPEELPTTTDNYVSEMKYHYIQAGYNALANDDETVSKYLNALVWRLNDYAEALDVDLEAVIEAAHRSNMSKLDTDGKVVYREDGKIMKSDLFVPPTADIERIVFGVEDGN